MAELSDSFVTFDGIINARDLGGIRTADGSVVRKGLLLRGGSLAKASDRDLERLAKEYKVARIFDFRTDMEIKYAPDRAVAGADNVWLPTVDPDTERLGKTNLPPHAYRDLLNFLVENRSDERVRYVAKNMYIELVENEYTQLQYAAFIQMIASAEADCAVFWHCSQGKDRTGMGAAYLLSILGADRRAIVEDYALSNEYYRDDLQKLRELLSGVGACREDYDVLSTFVGANVGVFEATLDFIDEKYGSLYNYCRDILMVSDDDINSLRSRLLLSERTFCRSEHFTSSQRAEAECSFR